MVIRMELSDVIVERRAYRSLAPVDIDEALITDLARHASLSASCFNNQPWRYIFVEDEAMLERMHSTLSSGNEWAKKASMIIAVLSEPDLDCRIKGRDYYLFDTGMATANLILRATDLGLVAHPIAGFSPRRVREVLDIPEETEVVTLIVVGRKADDVDDILSEKQKEAEAERPDRLQLSEFTYRNGYHPQDE